MTDQAPGPRKEDPRLDPLYLDPTSKDPAMDYRWFRVDSNTQWKLRPEFGWSAVPVESMPQEPSHEPIYIQRMEMRLYQRTKERAEQANTAALEKALNPLNEINEWLFPWWRLYDPWDKVEPVLGLKRLPSAAPYVETARRRDPPKSRIENHKRGKLLVIHEQTVPSWVAVILDRYQYGLTRLRLVYLPRGEAEVADYMWLSYADWAWARKDLVRERQIPSPGPGVRRLVITVKWPKITMPKISTPGWVKRLTGRLKR